MREEDWRKKFRDLYFSRRIGGYTTCEDCETFICQLLQEQESQMFKLVTEELGVEVGDMPAFPPAKMKPIDIIRLAIKIGLAKRLTNS